MGVRVHVLQIVQIIVQADVQEPVTLDVVKVVRVIAKMLAQVVIADVQVVMGRVQQALRG